MSENHDRHDFRKRKRRPKPGDLGALRRILWQAATEVEKLLERDEVDVKLRSASTLATLGGVYLKAIEAADFEKRLAAVEERLKEQETQR
jgi:hypothetical protein